MNQSKHKPHSQPVLVDLSSESPRSGGTGEEKLRAALEQNRIKIYWQPIVELETGEIQGIEALARMEDPSRGTLPPKEFLGDFVSEGRAVQFDRYFCRRLATVLSGWPKPALADLPLGVHWNVSTPYFLHRDFEGDVNDLINNAPLNPFQLSVDIAEETISTQRETTQTILKSLQDLGVRSGLDDFGTGYSSLADISSWPIDVLKIDQSFVIEWKNHGRHEHLIRGLIALGEHLEMDVIAEGVESDTIRSSLRSWGCPWGQGFHFDRPMESETMKRRLEERQQTPSYG